MGGDQNITTKHGIINELLLQTKTSYYDMGNGMFTNEVDSETLDMNATLTT